MHSALASSRVTTAQLFAIAGPAMVANLTTPLIGIVSTTAIGRLGDATLLGGVAMAAGTYVHIGIGAANRDPAQFQNPDRLDIRRQPNRHLAFGTGIHACAGMSLARMEAQVAIGRLLQRFSDIEPTGAFIRSGRARFRGFKSYPVRLKA